MLVNNYHFYIYTRPGFPVTNKFGARVSMLEAPLLEISSTRIREMIRQKKSIRFLVPDVVKEEIESNSYYRL